MNRPAHLLGMMLLLGCTTTAGASAEETGVQPPPWYYGLGIGLSVSAYNGAKIANDFAAANASSTYNSDDFTFKLYGGYRLDPFLAIEFGLGQLGRTVATTNGLPSKLFNSYNSFVNATMTRPYNDNASLFGKVGVHFWTIGPSASSKLAEGTDLALSAGIEFTLSDDRRRMMRIELDHYMFDNIYIDTTDSVTLNLVFKH